MQAKIAKFIDHTALSAEKTEQDILRLCDEAVETVFSPYVSTLVIFLWQNKNCRAQM